jgi:hypothetical protein
MFYLLVPVGIPCESVAERGTLAQREKYLFFCLFTFAIAVHIMFRKVHLEKSVISEDKFSLLDGKLGFSSGFGKSLELCPRAEMSPVAASPIPEQL